MITSWLVYNVVVAGLLGLAGVALERFLRQYGIPTRMVWASVLVGSVAVPLLSLAGVGPEPGAGVASRVLGVIPAGSLDAVDTTVSRLDAADGLALGLWLTASVIVAALFVFSLVAMVARRRRWSVRTVGGCPVMVSEDTGPAVAGFFRSVIVLPRWALQVDDQLRGLMLEHEREHVRAGDPRLLLTATLLLLYMPINPLIWWQMRRLRLAVEVDCDARVLRRHHADLPTYGRLLLEVGARASGCRLPVASFSSPASTLEARIRAMTTRRPRRHAARSLAFLVAAGAVTVGAAFVPSPGAVYCALGHPNAECSAGHGPTVSCTDGK